MAISRRSVGIVALLVVLASGVAGAYWAGLFRRHEAAPPPPAAAREPALDERVKQYLWDIEHLAFVVEQKVFPELKKALVAADKQALASYLAADFRARAPGDAALPDRWPSKYQDSVCQFRETVLHEANVRTLDANGFVDLLAAWRSLLGTGSGECKAEIGNVRFNPVTRYQMQGPWTGVWRCRLYGTRDGRRVELNFRLVVGLDPPSDDIPKRRHWIRTAAVENISLAEGSHTLLADVTLASGIDVSRMHDNWVEIQKHTGGTGGVYLCDYNGDGALDVLVTDVAVGAVLYSGDGRGHFARVANLLDPSTLGADNRISACFADFDNDGDEDLLLGVTLLENVDFGRSWRTVSDSGLQVHRPGALVVADYDLDGLVDIYEVHAHNGGYNEQRPIPKKAAWIDGGWGFHNILWKNLGNWKFADVTEKANAGGDGGSPFTALFLDYNNDRYPDILSINEFGKNCLLMNQRDGSFRKLDDLDPIFGGFSMGATAGDFDNDGNTDVYIANMYSKAGNRILSNVDPKAYPLELYNKITEATLGNKLYKGKGDGSFEQLPPEACLREVGWTYGPAFFDLNGDGFLDIYSTAGFVSFERGKPDG